MLSNTDYNILRLFRSRNVGPSTFFKILKFFDNCDNAIGNIKEFNSKLKLKNPIILSNKEDIDKEIVACSTVGAKIITYLSDEYPSLLLEINSFPPVLTCLGNINLLKRKSISIVGARTASSNGCNFAKKLSNELGKAGYVITSGFASGIDTASHKGAIDTGTIAVLGAGVDDIYPRGNEELYYEIKNKGLILSELPFNSSPKAENFPARNRIVSGLSTAIVIIEASARSGTLHTARQAIEQNRELLVIPGNPYDYRSEGSNKLIRDGATVITGTDDILEIVENLHTFSSNNEFKFSDNNTFMKETENNEELNTNKKISSEFDEENSSLNLKDTILSKLNFTPIAIDLLIEDLGISTSEINSALIELEMEDKVLIEHGCVILINRSGT